MSKARARKPPRERFGAPAPPLVRELADSVGRYARSMGWIKLTIGSEYRLGRSFESWG